MHQCLSPLILWVQIPLRRCTLDTKFCDKVYQWLVAGQWFSPGTAISSTCKTDCQDITEILLKVALDTIKQTNKHLLSSVFSNKTAASAVWRLAWSRRVRYIVRSPRSGQIKDNTEDWHLFLLRLACNTDSLTLNQDNVSEWSDMSTRGLHVVSVS